MLSLVQQKTGTMKNKLFFTILLSSSSLFAQKDFARLNIFFDSIEKHHTFSGSVAMTENNELIFERHFGILEAKNNTPVQADSKFRIGSISKTFTATLIMKAVEEKKLKTTDKLSKYFPTVVNAKSITVEHLLRHQSGIFNFTNDTLFWERNENLITNDQLVSIISNYSSQFKPGTKYEYSNSGYFLLASILEKIYQKPYAELLKEKITVPLGLNNTYEGTSIKAENNEAESVYYSFGNKTWKQKNITHSSHLLGAGGIVSTPTELNLFMTALMNGKIVSDRSLTLMKTMKMNYGYGLFLMPYHLNLGYGHTGGIDTYSAVTAYFEKEKLNASVTLNGYEGAANDITVAMLATYYGDSIKMPKPINYYPVKEDVLSKYEGTYYNAQHKITLKVKADLEEKTVRVKVDAQPEISTVPLSQYQFEVSMVDAKFSFLDNGSVTLNQFGNKIVFLRQ